MVEHRDADDTGKDAAAKFGNPADAPSSESEIGTRSGKHRLIRWNTTELRSASGEITGVATIGEDITDQRLAETKIKRLNRVYAILSGINTLIVRLRDREELYREACRIAVELGHFKFAWIGIANQTARTIELLASAGDDDGYLAKIASGVRLDAPGRRGLVATAMETRKVAVCNDIASDHTLITNQAEALLHGCRSAVALPLMVSGKAYGALILYAGEANFFDDPELVLLEELSGDIAFALEHIANAERLDYLAYYDELTGLANSTLFRERLGQFVSTAQREKAELGLAIFNVERFKTINDTLGRAAGDELPKQIAERARCAVADSNWMSRTGADHFAVVFPEMVEAESARWVSAKYKEIFDAPFQVGGTELRVAARLGIAMFPNDGSDADTLLRNAEAAVKNAKTSGERYMFYTQSMSARVAEKMSMENKLRGALEKDQFVLHYQPKISLDTRRICGVEALIRWNDPASGLVPPAQFVPLLEETGLILEVGQWALMRAVLDHAHWTSLGLAAPRVAVNVSAIQLRQRDFVEVVKQARALGSNPTGIDLEITESLLMDGIDANIATLTMLRGLGITLYIDDFGTGYSSLGYLARLPVQSLKIDRSFVVTMLQDPNTMALVSTIISMAHSLRLKVVAEDVEDEEQAQILRLLRCEEMQGYLFSKPVPREEITALLKSGHVFDQMAAAPPGVIQSTAVGPRLAG